jgi:hypothetical protein
VKPGELQQRQRERMTLFELVDGDGNVKGRELDYETACAVASDPDDHIPTAVREITVEVVKRGSSETVEPSKADPISVAAELQKAVGRGKFKVTSQPGLYANLPGDGSDLLLGRFPDFDENDEFPSDRNVIIDASQPNPKRQLVTELRRVAAVWSELADRVERPNGAPPLTYAVVSIPDGRIHGRGYSRDQADEIAFIWNQDLEHHKRAAVIPDVDLRHRRVCTGDLDPSMLAKHEWPTYAVGIYDRNGLVRIQHLPDPRIEWCQKHNSVKGATHAAPLFSFADEDSAIPDELAEETEGAV